MPILRPHDDQLMSLDIRLLLGRYWLKLVAPLASAAAAEYICRVPVTRRIPRSPGTRRSLRIRKHGRLWRLSQVARWTEESSTST